MLISYSHQFIFFHIAKVAGISIREALKPYVQEPEKFKIKRPPKKLDNGAANPLYEMWESSLTHAKAKEVKADVSSDIYNGFYKFSFVRNPWDWQVSMYHFLLKETSNIRYDLIRSMNSFEEYLEWVICAKNPYPKGATKLQKEMVVDENNNLIVDFIGKYENLNQDFAQICQVLKINATLPHLNQSSHRDYKLYYNERTQKMVAEHFSEDIELFRYTFEGSY